MNIVFDLGGVVFRWQPNEIIASVFHDPETQDLVMRQVIEHPDWIELDRGTLAPEEAIDRASRRTGLPRTDIETLMAAVPRFLTPIEETLELIGDLQGRDNRLFVLSNMQIASIEHLEKTHGIWDLFDGIVISSRINMVKPEAAIYRHLLTVHQLDARKTIFIDDMPENVAAAAALDIGTIRFIDSSQCRQALTNLGCLGD